MNRREAIKAAAGTVTVGILGLLGLKRTAAAETPSVPTPDLPVRPMFPPPQPMAWLGGDFASFEVAAKNVWMYPCVGGPMDGRYEKVEEPMRYGDIRIFLQPGNFIERGRYRRHMYELAGHSTLYYLGERE